MHQATAIGAGRGRYFTSIGRDDYYTQGGEPLGEWYGLGVEALGVSGEVKASDFHNLMAGKSADGTRDLVQQQKYTKKNEHGQKEREKVAGIDLTYSVPKSVSVVWAVSGAELRRAIQEAHDRAVKSALDFAQTEAGFSRAGKGGTEEVRANFAVAIFQHGTSRSLDPHLHSHAVVLNVAGCEDGKRQKHRTLDAHRLYDLQRASWMVYEAELARNLEGLGFRAERKGKTFELAGVPQKLCNEWSKRRQQIEKEIAIHGDGGWARERAALETREAKEQVPREKLYDAWRTVADQLGFSHIHIEALRSAPKRLHTIEDPLTGHIREVAPADIFKKAAERLSKEQSHFTARDFFATVAHESQVAGTGALVEKTRQHLETSNNIICLGRLGKEVHYTTAETLEREARMLNAVESCRGNAEHCVKATTLIAALEKVETAQGFQLYDEQRHAVEHITMERGAVKVVTGMAGTGKTTMLKAANECWTREGLNVIGCALAGKAADGLQEGSGIQSETIAKTLKNLQEGKLVFDRRTVLVVDEAGMVDSVQLEKLIGEVLGKGGKLVLVGDGNQLQAIGPGGGFQGIRKRLGEEARLEHITRQKEGTPEQKIVKQFALGQAREALQTLAENGRLHVSSNQHNAIRKLISDWESFGGAANAKDHLMLTGKRDATAKLNALAQERARAAGQLGDGNIWVNGKTLFEGDRVVFELKSKTMGVRNGTLGTIENIDRLRQSVTVTLDNGKKAYVSLSSYDRIDLAYAVTVHKSQGVTVQKNAYALTAGSMTDLHLTYVQASRAKAETRFYTTRTDAGDELKRLSDQMSRERQKTLAHDVVAHEQIQQQQEQRRSLRLKLQL